VPGLTRLGRRGGADRGAVTVLVAVLISSGVLLGMTAFAVDIGTLYSYRDMALNSASAAAMAAAQGCVRPGPIRCGTVDTEYASANMSGTGVVLDSADISGQPVCGKDADTGRLHRCTDPTGAKQCIGTRPDRTSYAEVHATTKAPDSATVYPSSFAGQAVPGFNTNGVQACARVAWGPPHGPYPLFTLSKCVFDELTRGIHALDPAFYPPYSPPNASAEVRLDLQPGPPTTRQGCGDPGFGNLGYLDTFAVDCLVDRPGDLHQDGTIDGHTNDATGTYPLPKGCRDLLDRKERRPDLSDPQPYLLMPIYQAYSLDADHTDFEKIYGIAAFQVTCDHLDATGTFDWLTASSSTCGGSTPSTERYLRGYFVWANIIDGTWPALDWNYTLGVATYKTVG
jgi:hypothetical protein